MKQFIYLFFSVVLTTSSLHAQSLSDRTIFVRFKTGTSVSVEKGSISVSGIPLSISSGRWQKTYTMNAEKLDSLRAVASKNLHKEIRDINLDYRFTVDNIGDLQPAIDQLLAHDFIFSARKAPKLYSPSAPDYQSFQGYLKNGSIGINAEEVWAGYNNHGEGIAICDLEYGFNANHLDLPGITVIGASSQDPFEGGGIDHGTAVFGEMAALHNGIGVTGIAYGSSYLFCGTYYDELYQLENALLETTMHLIPGDIVLIEQQIAGPLYTGSTDQFGLVPVEWIPEYYDVIQIVAGQGIIVVEAAGNGQQNLDDPIYQQDNFDHYPFIPGNGSGAIIVGAGSVGTSDVQRSAMWYTNYGSAVDLQAHGESIYTTGYGGIFGTSQNEYYTATFGGTSGASPIVTGAIALLNSVYYNETGEVLSRDEIVNVLTLTGKSQQDGDFEVSEAHIGPLPNVKEALDYLLANVSIDENQTSGLMVYPNPATENVTINCSPDKVLQLNDLSGKTVPCNFRDLMNGYTELATEELPSGMYFLHTVSGSEIQTTKISLN